MLDFRLTAFLWRCVCRLKDAVLHATCTFICNTALCVFKRLVFTRGPTVYIRFVQKSEHTQRRLTWPGWPWVWLWCSSFSRLVNFLLANNTHIGQTKRDFVTRATWPVATISKRLLKRGHGDIEAAVDNTAVVYTVSQKTTLTLHTTSSKHINRFFLFLAEMLLSEYAIELWFAILPLLTNVSALPGKKWTPEIGSFQSCSETSFGLLYLRHSSTNFDIFCRQ